MQALTAAIFGLSGPELTAEEERFFQESQPVGYILFVRNIKSKAQLSDLTDKLKSISGKSAPILIDQEGGRVQRVVPPLAKKKYPAANDIAQKYQESPAKCAKKVERNYKEIGTELKKFGFSVNCAPVLDLLQDDTTTAIASRTFGADPAQVTDLGAAAVRGLLAAGIIPVIKHMPGHGRATVDSHHELPVIHASREELNATDFVPFDKLTFEFGHQIWAMTSHLKIPSIGKSPVTYSERIVQNIIRDQFDFDGILLTDDIDMHALDDTYAERTLRALEAGHDIVLQCNGDLDCMRQVAEVCPALSPESEKRFYRSQIKSSAAK